MQGTLPQQPNAGRPQSAASSSTAGSSSDRVRAARSVSVDSVLSDVPSTARPSVQVALPTRQDVGPVDRPVTVANKENDVLSKRRRSSNQWSGSNLHAAKLLRLELPPVTATAAMPAARVTSGDSGTGAASGWSVAEVVRGDVGAGAISADGGAAARSKMCLKYTAEERVQLEQGAFARAMQLLRQCRPEGAAAQPAPVRQPPSHKNAMQHIDCFLVPAPRHLPAHRPGIQSDKQRSTAAKSPDFNPDVTLSTDQQNRPSAAGGVRKDRREKKVRRRSSTTNIFILDSTSGDTRTSPLKPTCASTKSGGLPTISANLTPATGAVETSHRGLCTGMPPTAALHTDVRSPIAGPAGRVENDKSTVGYPASSTGLRPSPKSPPHCVGKVVACDVPKVALTKSKGTDCGKNVGVGHQQADCHASSNNTTTVIQTTSHKQSSKITDSVDVCSVTISPRKTRTPPNNVACKVSEPIDVLRLARPMLRDSEDLKSRILSTTGIVVLESTETSETRRAFVGRDGPESGGSANGTEQSVQGCEGSDKGLKILCSAVGMMPGEDADVPSETGNAVGSPIQKDTVADTNRRDSRPIEQIQTPKRDQTVSEQSSSPNKQTHRTGPNGGDLNDTKQGSDYITSEQSSDHQNSRTVCFVEQKDQNKDGDRVTTQHSRSDAEQNNDSQNIADDNSAQDSQPGTRPMLRDTRTVDRVLLVKDAVVTGVTTSEETNKSVAVVGGDNEVTETATKNTDCAVPSVDMPCITGFTAAAPVAVERLTGSPVDSTCQPADAAALSGSTALRCEATVRGIEVRTAANTDGHRTEVAGGECEIVDSVAVKFSGDTVLLNAAAVGRSTVGKGCVSSSVSKPLLNLRSAPAASWTIADNVSQSTAAVSHAAAAAVAAVRSENNEDGTIATYHSSSAVQPPKDVTVSCDEASAGVIPSDPTSIKKEPPSSVPPSVYDMRMPDAGAYRILGTLYSLDDNAWLNEDVLEHKPLMAESMLDAGFSAGTSGEPARGMVVSAAYDDEDASRSIDAASGAVLKQEPGAAEEAPPASNDSIFDCLCRVADVKPKVEPGDSSSGDGAVVPVFQTAKAHCLSDGLDARPRECSKVAVDITNISRVAARLSAFTPVAKLRFVHSVVTPTRAAMLAAEAPQLAGRSALTSTANSAAATRTATGNRAKVTDKTPSKRKLGQKADAVRSGGAAKGSSLGWARLLRKPVLAGKTSKRSKAGSKSKRSVP